MDWSWNSCQNWELVAVPPQISSWDCLGCSRKELSLRLAKQDKPPARMVRWMRLNNVKHGCIGTAEFRIWAKSWGEWQLSILHVRTGLREVCERFVILATCLSLLREHDRVIAWSCLKRSDFNREDVRREDQRNERSGAHLSSRPAWRLANVEHLLLLLFPFIEQRCEFLLSIGCFLSAVHSWPIAIQDKFWCWVGSYSHHCTST